MKKSCIVTGGTKGIGRAIVEKFASNGFDIITTSRSEMQLVELKSEMQYKYPDCAIYTIQTDQSIKSEVEKFASFCLSRTKSIDILIANTGVYVPGQIHSEQMGVLEQMIETNLYSAYHLIRAIVPEMIKKKEGHIFTLCSTASIKPYINGGSYCISKFALYGLTKVLREEMKEHNIKVTAVLPGATLTSSWDNVDLPKERFMQSEDIANAIYNTTTLSKSAVVEEILLRPMEGDIE
ncbi:MAG: SDR family oxidoreductase [Bacteroidota bacterium]|nr:SDR family oxidoreductase [Bacteroidota bacterium]